MYIPRVDGDGERTVMLILKRNEQTDILSPINFTYFASHAPSKPFGKRLSLYEYLIRRGNNVRTIRECSKSDDKGMGVHF
jgi:hypothetical protein